jgi:hypothetical protein
MVSQTLLLKETIWFLLISFIVLIGCDGKKHPSMPAKTSPKEKLRISIRDTIQATDLFDYYVHSLSLDREKEAQKVLKGKKFYIKGRIKMPDKDWKDRLEFVLLKAHQKDNNSLIICQLSDKMDQEKLSGLAENTSIILFGEYIGFNNFPNLKDCRLISANSLN